MHLKTYWKNFKDLVYSIKRAMGYSFHYNPVMTVVIALFSVLMAILPFAQTKTLGLIVDQFISSIGSGVIDAKFWQVLTLFVIANVIPDLVYALKGYFDTVWRFSMQKELELLLASKRGALDLAYSEDSEYQNLLQRVWWRGFWPLMNITDSQLTNIQNIISVIIASTVIIAVDWRIFSIIMISLIPKLIVEVRFGKEVWGIWSDNSEVRRRYYNILDHFTDRGRAVQTKLLQNNSYLMGLLRKFMNIFIDKEVRANRKKIIYQILSIAFSIAGYVLAIVILVKSVVAGLIAIGTLVFILASLDRLNSSISGFFLSIANQYTYSLQVLDILKVLDTKPFLPITQNPVKLNLHQAPKIVFENVSFHYKGQTKNILDTISLTINVGEKLALVGNNGAGKTTLIKLLCRVYDPTSGRILINGTDLRDVELDEWWSYLGVLFQDFSSYDFKVKESIGMGRASAEVDMENVLRSAELSGADEFIKEWAHQYEQMIGIDFNGVEPSKGQNQKLALARVAYRKAHLLILDEPTASVDAESEEKIFERLEQLPDTISAILISHRFSTVRKADRIIVLEHGTITENGSHDELMAKKGTYAKLFAMQAKGYEN